jgi:hypothetical protein
MKTNQLLNTFFLLVAVVLTVGASLESILGDVQ